MKDEKSLSDKIEDIKNRILLGYNEGITIERIKQNNPRVRIILEMEEDVKEAVKRLKDGFDGFPLGESWTTLEICESIDKIMGDNLI